jgi:energy-coupling factor transporter ATP-binding protein EcfA2
LTIRDQLAGDQITVGSIDGSEGVAIGQGARVEINRYTELIIRPDSFEDVPPAPGSPPYKGLAYFTEEDADNFFGREEVSGSIAAQLQKTAFLAVIGASGSGKSSLLRAGVVPQLRAQNWLVQLMTPTARPLLRLSNVLVREDSPLTAADELQSQLTTNTRALHLLANRLVAQSDHTKMVLIIDQFEELFTLCSDGDERKAFIDILLNALEERGTLTILIGMRADFYGRTAEFDGLRTLISKQQEFIGPLQQRDLVRVIAEPAKRGGWQFVEGLVEQILEDAGGEPGYLPLLSHALLETWDLRRGTVMTLGGYRAVGGVEGAIAQTAEDTLQKVDASQIPVVKHIFLSLTELGEGSEDTRRITTRAELGRIDVEDGVIDGLVEDLVRARLITVDGDTIQVAHEAIIRRWPRLRSWIDEDRERLSFNRRLTRAVEEWEENERQPDYLFRGARLSQAESRIEEYQTWGLTDDQAVFIQASQEAEAEAALEEQKREEVGRQEARLSTNFAILGGVLGLGLAAVMVNLVTQEMAGILAAFYVAGGFITGGFVGFFYAPFFDSIVSAMRQRSEALAWPAAILSGIIAFLLASSLFFFLVSEDFLVVLVVGSAWGTAAGGGRFWIRSSDRPRFISISIVSVLTGIVLVTTYAVLQQVGLIKQPFALWLVFVIGLLVPLAILLGEEVARIANDRRNR